jgi:hypothetical protein
MTTSTRVLTCIDSLGHTLRVCSPEPDGCPYWRCPHCGDHCITIGSRSGRVFGQKRFPGFPYIRCNGCSYRATINGPSANDFCQKSPAEQAQIRASRDQRVADRAAELASDISRDMSPAVSAP